jgi:hypothetical protein
MRSELVAITGLLGLVVGCSSPEPSGVSTEPAALGLPCEASADCGSSFCVEEARTGSSVSWTAGTCTQACSSSAACPPGSACVPFDDGTALCLGSCVQSGDCRAGYVCSTAVSACLPDCRLGFSCGTSLSCDAGSGACVPGTRVVGDPCTTNADCASGLCTLARSTSTGIAWSGGYCTAICDAAVPCPAPSQCVSYSDGSSCAAACSADTDCRGGYVCSTAVGACLPDCRQGFSCGSALTCDAATGACA